MEAQNRIDAKQPSPRGTLNLQPVPRSLEEAVEALVTVLTPIERDFILRMSRPLAQKGLGFLARQQWNLSDPDSPLVRWFIEHCGVSHAQDLSALLMDALWSRLHEEPAQTQELADRLQQEWRGLGLDPRAGVQLPTRSGDWA